METILQAIGHTPLMKLKRTVPESAAEIYVKLEWFNPGGSVKDRIADYLIAKAEKSGELKPGATVIEPTSGNTGIGLAMVCAVKKYRLILVMPENYSVERRLMMREMGAEIVLTPAAEEMMGAIAKAEALLREISGAWMPRQFSNPHNPEAHRRGTAAEIFEDLPAEEIDALVLGVGTGGTLTGLAQAIKAQRPSCHVVAVEPAQAAVLSGQAPAVHRIQGIGPGFVPEILERPLIDQVLTVSDEDAYAHTKRLSREEGLLVGISSGAAFAAALRVARDLGEGKKVLTVFPDKGERYFSIEKYFS